MRFAILLAAAVALAAVETSGDAEPLLNPGGIVCPSLWTPAQTARLREHAAQPAFAPVLATAAAALDRPPRSLTRIIYEGRLGKDPERVRCNEHLQDLGVLRCLVLE